jgi:enoyl-CoA hydratase/carnithine racemase
MSNLVTEVNERVMTITFSRPEKKNALTTAMYEAFSDALERAGESDDVAVVVITGSGDSFCAGNDLKDFLSGPGDISGPSPQARLIRNLATFAKPLFAAVDGITVGIGVTMLLHCDAVFSSDRSRFKTGFVDLGVVPEAGSTRLLRERVGALNASALFLLGDVVSAPEAHRLGLVTDIVDDVVVYAQSRAHQLSEKSLDAVMSTKALLRNSQGSLEDVIERENVEFSRLLKSEAFREAASKLIN